MNKTFKAVDFMREVRNELSDLYQNDKEQYHKELQKTMAEFLSARAKTSPNIVIADNESVH